MATNDHPNSDHSTDDQPNKPRAVEHHQVIVVGGGIAGLTTAWHLFKAGVDVKLLEASDGVGGFMRTEHRDGFLLEKGPFNIIVRDPTFEDLLNDLSDDLQVVAADASARSRYIYRHGGLMRVPSNPAAMLSTRLLSFGGKLRALRGMLVSQRAATDDYTIAEFATRRLGKEVSDTMVSAVIAGILAGDINKLSAPACFPFISDFDRNARSPLAYAFGKIVDRLKKKGERRKRKWRGLVSIDRGLGAIGESIAKHLGERVVTDCRVGNIVRTADGYSLTGSHHATTGSTEYSCRELVLATPAGVAATLLQPVSSELGGLLASIQSASMAVVSLAYKRHHVGHPLRGFGFLVPQNEPAFPLMGVLWSDSAFPHHAPDDHRLLRVFIGGVRTPNAVERGADALVSTAQNALRDLLQITGQPTLTDVWPYPTAIPQYHLGHQQKVQRIREAVQKLPNLSLAGNYLDGVSISDCVRVGKDVAHRIINMTPENNERRGQTHAMTVG